MTPMMDPMQKLSEDQFFMRIDLTKGYWQIPMSEEDITKTVFVTPDGEESTSSSKCRSE